jgi:hypothetical protein
MLRIVPLIFAIAAMLSAASINPTPAHANEAEIQALELDLRRYSLTV